jgi:hypothetical protein
MMIIGGGEGIIWSICDVLGWIWSSGMLSKINFLHFLPGFWEQSIILSVSIHISNQYPASLYNHPSTWPYDDNWWWWGGHLVHLWCAG